MLLNNLVGPGFNFPTIMIILSFAILYFLIGVIVLKLIFVWFPLETVTDYRPGDKRQYADCGFLCLIWPLILLVGVIVGLPFLLGWLAVKILESCEK